MKGTRKITKSEEIKNENENGKVSDTQSSSTPEISARSRQSLDGAMAQREDEKEIEIQQLKALLQEQNEKLEQTQEALRYSQTERQETSQAYAEISQKLSNSIPITPGPNVNKPRLPRPQDLVCQTASQNQGNEKNDDDKDTSEEKNILKIFSHLTNVLKETNKADVNMPTKFNGDDNNWEAWSKQWRTYLQAKEWLATAEHPKGPGATGFDYKINAKIYNCLINLCQKGKAITYVEQAAEFDGYGANKQLLIRYDGFSKQKLQSLKKCVEMMKHISGTNITHHIDKFEKVCGQMVNCGFTLTEEEKIDWFLASIHERTYDAMHAHCINLQLQSTLTFAQLIKLYTHQCFAKYPHFQVEDLNKDNKY
jgi:hypothetical protein